MYQGENLNQALQFLIPHTIDNVDVADASVFLNYIRPDNSADVVSLTRAAEDYSEDYYLYELPVTSSLTWFAGECRLWIQIMSGSPYTPIVAKTGECVVFVHRSANLDSTMRDEYISELYRIENKIDNSVQHKLW